MEHYTWLDVSLQATAVCVIDKRGRVVIESKVPSEPDAIASFLQPYTGYTQVGQTRGGLACTIPV